MKKLTILAAGLLLLVPTLAFSDSIQLRLGYFMPRFSTDLTTHPDSLWAIELDQMSFGKKDYKGGMIGIAYDRFVGKYINLSLALDTYNQSELGYYNDWVLNTLDEGDFAFPFELYLGNDITHSFRVTSTPLQLSVKLLPLGRRTKLIPYIGGGASLVFWNVRMFGDMVNFADPWVYTDPDLGDVDIYPVESVLGRESGTAFGWHAFGGLQFPVGYRATIEAEVRYHSVKAKFEDWFVGFEDLDLGGLALTLGLSYWF
jgi:opacity protein-like surface antigen